MSKQFDYESKIAALLERAERETTQEARDMFTAKAQELMLKKGISEAQARAAAGEVHDVEQIVIKSVAFNTRYGRGHMMIAHSITTNFGGLRGYYVQRHNSEHCSWFVVGYESDVDMAVTLINSVIAQAESARLAWWKSSIEKAMGVKGRDAWKVQRNFLMGYGPEVGAKVRAVYNRVVKEAEESTPGTAIMLRDKQREVDDFMDNRGGMRKGKGYSIGSMGYGAGANAGRQADVGGRSVGRNKGIES